MSTFSFESSGSFDNTEKWLRQMADSSIFDSLSKFGQEGVDALAGATPQDTGVTAQSWYYEIVKDANSWSIVWGNTHIEKGRPIAVLLQLGHGTGTGGYVEGRDYINPALRPIFDRILAEAERVVNSA
jgi:hypothetical protein